MTTPYLEFPKSRLLWPGAILGSIAHAVAVARHPDLAHEQSWDGNNYSVQDSAGSRGTVAFAGDRFVGVFFSDGSERNPFKAHVEYDLQPLLKGLPDEVTMLAHNDALQYVLQNYKGATRPIVTAAFWGDGRHERVAAAEPWCDVFENGAFLIRNQVLSPDVAIAAWKSEYELSDYETALVKSLFERKLSSLDSHVRLEADHQAFLETTARGEEGLKASRESFAEIGIRL